METRELPHSPYVPPPSAPASPKGPMMSDELIERLQSHMGKADIEEDLTDCRLAADTITALRAEVERLREALEPFVRHGRALGVFDGDPGPHWIMTDKGHRDVPALDFMRARATLTQTKDTTDDA